MQNVSAGTSRDAMRAPLLPVVPDPGLPPPNTNEAMIATMWFDAMLARGRSERFVCLGSVTPALAAVMLERNTVNRPTTTSRSTAHVQRLQSGKFRMTHQGISFASNGRLLDGQHRLNAIVTTGIAGGMTITFGADEDEFEVIDQGAPRTASHTLGIKGLPHSALRAAVGLTVLFLEREPHIWHSPQEVVEFVVQVDQDPRLGPLMNEACRVGQAMRSVTPPTSAGLAAYWIGKHTAHHEVVRAYWNGLDSGENLTGARLKVRNWLMRRDAEHGLKQGRTSTILRAAVLIEGWNAWVAKRKTVNTDWDTAVRLPKVA